TPAAGSPTPAIMTPAGSTTTAEPKNRFSINPFRLVVASCSTSVARIGPDMGLLTFGLATIDGPGGGGCGQCADAQREQCRDHVAAGRTGERTETNPRNKGAAERDHEP